MSEFQPAAGRARGGQARADRLTGEERRSQATAAARARWEQERADGPLPKATHRGELHIGSARIPCAVLEDGRRVLSEHGITTALGSRSGASKRLKMAARAGGDSALPIFLAPSNIRPFFDATSGPFRPLLYRDGRRHVVGYEAAVLPAVCDVWLQARDAGVLQVQQQERAYKAEVLMRGLASVGIVALVDEATGYQEERERDELHRLLAAYLSEERLAWAKRFPDEFYKHLYRLWGWHWPPKGAARNQYIGKLTNCLVYDRLPPGVLDELRRRNPTVPGTRRRRWQHHQFLSEDLGQPDLRDHLLQLVAIMRVSADRTAFEANFERAFPGDQGRLDL